MSDDLYTAEEAAAQVGVKRQTIYVWTNRGFLKAAGKHGKYNLYRLSDVFTCEASRKREHRRRPQA